MRHVIGLAVLFLVIGCGEKGHETKIKFPAKIQSFSHFSADQQTKAEEAIAKLNEEAGTTLISLDSQSSYHPVSIEVVSQIKTEDNEDASSQTVGFATNYYTRCRILLKADLFSPTKASLLVSVLWHELGHCAGFGHDSQEGQIMFRKAVGINEYSSDSIFKFVQRLLQMIP